MKRYGLIFLTLTLMILSSAILKAQVKGSLQVVKDPLIDTLIARKIAANKAATNNSSSITAFGYRVQIYVGSDRKEAYTQQAQFKSMYPELGTYISFTQPNYRIKVGDFRTRSEAQRLVAELKPTFPTLFIFNERINPNKVVEVNND